MLWLGAFAFVAVTASALYVVTTIQDSFDSAFSGNEEEIEKPPGYDYFNLPQKMTFFLNSVSFKAWAGIATSVFLIISYSNRRN